MTSLEYRQMYIYTVHLYLSRSQNHYLDICMYISSTYLHTQQVDLCCKWVSTGRVRLIHSVFAHLNQVKLCGGAARYCLRWEFGDNAVVWSGVQTGAISKGKRYGWVSNCACVVEILIRSVPLRFTVDERFLTSFGSQETRLCIVQEELTALEITNIIMRQEILHPAL